MCALGLDQSQSGADHSMDDTALRFLLTARSQVLRRGFLTTADQCALRTASWGAFGAVRGHLRDLERALRLAALGGDRVAAQILCGTQGADGSRVAGTAVDPAATRGAPGMPE